MKVYMVSAETTIEAESVEEAKTIFIQSVSESDITDVMLIGDDED